MDWAQIWCEAVKLIEKAPQFSILFQIWPRDAARCGTHTIHFIVAAPMVRICAKTMPDLHSYMEEMKKMMRKREKAIILEKLGKKERFRKERVRVFRKGTI